MAADCSFFRLSMAFKTVCVQYCLAAGSKLLIIPLFNSFHDSWAPYCSADGTVLQILALVDSFYDGCVPYCSADSTGVAHSSAGQRLSRRFACCISQRMVVYCSFCPLSTVFTFCALYCSVEGRGLLILPFVYGLHDGLLTVSLILPVVYDFPDLSRVLLLNPWQRIARSSAHRWVSRFAHRIA